ncbi:nuclease-related domain-containing protein [Thalassobacillus pellis]|uniref:nuclease-related domain-containing protein n=1 Tax=Thalassobacillus pellis TaxID=748008 RepID=UPI0019619F27|nr:nuclease-related domain-containing protein [Thalassobacillus pellis]MBM7551641.1 hypothetical protein [Thalassobacillus pellis]
MIIKPRNLPIEIRKLESLQRRLSLKHPQYQHVSDQLGKFKSGHNGEESLDFPLSFLSTQKYRILHNLRLNDGSRFFQLDTLILSPQFLLILEVKNYSGTLTFNTSYNQLIREKDGLEEAFPDPVIQVTRQQEQLQAWMQAQLGFTMMVETLVVFANERTVVKSTENDKETMLRVTNRSALPYRIRELEKKHQHNKKHELKSLSDYLIRANQEIDWDILEKYQIKRTEIKTGVACPKCALIPMLREFRVWACPRCQFKSRDSHLEALKDYYYLISPTISNREARDFLHISSRDIAYWMLRRLGSKSAGRGMRYNLGNLFDYEG